MIELKGTYKFPDQENKDFINPIIGIEEIVEKINPNDMTIDVSAYVISSDNINGQRFYFNMNPVKVNNLNYDGGELLQRVEERLEDFKIIE